MFGQRLMRALLVGERPDNRLQQLAGKASPVAYYCYAVYLEV